MALILVVDDDEAVRSFVAETLERANHDVVQVADGAEAIELLALRSVDLILTDLMMPVVSGMDLLRHVRLEQPDVEVIVFTAHGGVSNAVEAIKLGAFDYVEKPIAGPTFLRALVQRALDRRTQLLGASPRVPTPRASLMPRPGVSSVPGASSSVATHTLTFGAPCMQVVVDAVEKVTKTNSNVLLLGESGVGKEVFARAIHEGGTRKDRPFLAMNCAVLSSTLIESELFGHERGAFTGAHALRRGRMELAQGGTFFLDEVGELHPSVQAKLLRVLEEKTFTRLGGEKSHPLDVRWIAATHRDLRAMVREGTFREDLYHRLAVFPIRLPPLRERREDIVPLAERLLFDLATGKNPPRLADASKARLQAAPWPGNVRELRNVLERALILGAGEVLLPTHLWFEDDLEADAADTGRTSAESLEELEKQAIMKTLTLVRGHRRDAAARLGIGLRTLYQKLKRYDLK